MVTAKKGLKKAKSRLSKRSIVFLSIVGFLLLLIGVMRLRTYLIEEQAINELSESSEHIKILYDQMLTANADNVADSNFGNKCSESSVKIGKGRIVCWTGGVIILKNDIGLESAGRIMERSVIGNRLSSGTEANISDNQYYQGVSINYRSLYQDVICDGNYGQSHTKEWSYSISCRKDVPNFLPGYTVEK